MPLEFIIHAEPAASSHRSGEERRAKPDSGWLFYLKLQTSPLLLISPFLIQIKRTDTVINGVLKKARQCTVREGEEEGAWGERSSRVGEIVTKRGERKERSCGELITG